MAHEDQFTEVSEDRVKQAAKRIHERNKRNRKAFGERQFGTIRELTPAQDQAIYQDMRNVPAFWKVELEAEAQKKGLPNGMLPRKYVDNLFQQEKSHLAGEQAKGNGHIKPVEEIAADTDVDTEAIKPVVEELPDVV